MRNPEVLVPEGGFQPIYESVSDRTAVQHPLFPPERRTEDVVDGFLTLLFETQEPKRCVGLVLQANNRLVEELRMWHPVELQPEHVSLDALLTMAHELHEGNIASALEEGYVIARGVSEHSGDIRTALSVEIAVAAE